MKSARWPRLLYNGDCNFLFYNPELWQPEGGPFSARAIHRHVGFLARSGIDALLVNPNTQVAWYPSRRVPHVLAGYTRGDRAFVARIAAANAALTPAQVGQYLDVMTVLFDDYLDLIEAGVDWLAECAIACRAAGIAPWLSYRMNATHFSGTPVSPVNARVFRDPRNRLSGRTPAGGPPDHAWVGLNFARAAVRDHMFALIRDGVENYDYAGIELDWLRHPVCAEAPARPRDLDALTEWIADLRALTRRRRRDYPLGLRVPGNLDYLRSIGLDLPRLVRRGLLDFVVFSNYWQTPWTMPYADLRAALGPDIRIYGGIEGAPNWLPTLAPALRETPKYQELQLAGDSAAHGAAAKRRAAVRGTRYLPASAEFLRGAAAGTLAQPVDGLELFNFFVTDQVRVPGQHAQYDALRGLADPAALRGQDKHYAFNTASGASHEWWDAPMVLPATIPAGQSRTFRLPMLAEPAGGGRRVIVQLIATAGGRAPAVTLNGIRPAGATRAARDLLFPSGPYRRHVPEHRAWNAAFPTRAVRAGWNEITVRAGPAPLTLAGIEAAVKMRTGR